MAIKQGYFEDNKPEHYEEGPFVKVLAGGWRVEVKRADCICAGHVDTTIYHYLKEYGPTTEVWRGLHPTGNLREDEVDHFVDHLNGLVEEGVLEYDEDMGTWVHPEYETKTTRHKRSQKETT